MVTKWSLISKTSWCPCTVFRPRSNLHRGVDPNKANNSMLLYFRKSLQTCDTIGHDSEKFSGSTTIINKVIIGNRSLSSEVTANQDIKC